MAGDTKERILETALELFAQNGYLGTSMNDIAERLGFTKAALYKHYTSKQEILDKIVERMNEMDYERAESYEMPETEPDGFAEAYLHTPIPKIRAYSMAQFDHWTKEPFSSNFRKMLTLEQYRDPKLAQLHHDYLAGGPLEYMAAIFRKLTDTDEAAMQLALEAGNAKAVNMVLMGVLASRMDLPEDVWQAALAKQVPAKFLELNRRAFALGQAQKGV